MKVSNRSSFSPSPWIVPIHFTLLLAQSRILVSNTEASSGRANFGGPRRSTHRHQDTHPREVAMAGQRSERVVARFYYARHVRKKDVEQFLAERMSRTSRT